MKELSLDEIKRIEIKILKDVKEFCDENDITYFLACGTLLGAIRHKGFIPWDDDVDIMMPRPDYIRFLNVYNNKKYKLLKPSEGRFYYAKIYDPNTIKLEEGTDYSLYEPIGIDIDVFPLDGIVNDKKIIDKLYKRSSFFETLLNLSNQPIFYRKNPIKSINRIIPRIIGRKNLVKLIEKNAQTYDYDGSEYVIRMRKSSNGFTGALEKKVYDKSYMIFEGETYCVPKGYDIWLSSFYGTDYMKIPSIDKIKTHKNICYIKE